MSPISATSGGEARVKRVDTAPLPKARSWTPLSDGGTPSVARTTTTMNEHGSMDRLSTTTLSTIAVQSGNTRMVIALLHAGGTVHLKVVELDPGIAHLGLSFKEAAELQSSHMEVMQRLRSKQSPVEDLLRQADDLIAKQHARAPVYAAMAESLGLAWRDLMQQLDQRRVLLDQNYLFQGHVKVTSCSALLKNKAVSGSGMDD